VPKFPGVKLVVRVLGVSEDQHDDALDVGQLLHDRFSRVRAVLQGNAIKLALNQAKDLLKKKILKRIYF
jgi:hypothetical protein